MSLIALLLLAGCGSDTDSVTTEEPLDGAVTMEAGSPVSMTEAKQVNSENGDAITEAFDDVVGHGVGLAEGASQPSPDDEAYVIEVYIQSDADTPTGDYSIDGVPLRFKSTGPISAY